MTNTPYVKNDNWDKPIFSKWAQKSQLSSPSYHTKHRNPLPKRCLLVIMFSSCHILSVFQPKCTWYCRVNETPYMQMQSMQSLEKWWFIFNLAPEFYFRYFRILSGTDGDLDLDLMSSYLERYEVSEDELGVIWKRRILAFQRRQARLQRPHIARDMNSLSQGRDRHLFPKES